MFATKKRAVKMLFVLLKIMEQYASAHQAMWAIQFQILVANNRPAVTDARRRQYVKLDRMDRCVVVRQVIPAIPRAAVAFQSEHVRTVRPIVRKLLTVLQDVALTSATVHADQIWHVNLKIIVPFACVRIVSNSYRTMPRTDAYETLPFVMATVLAVAAVFVSMGSVRWRVATKTIVFKMKNVLITFVW